MTLTVPQVILEGLTNNESFARHVFPFLKEDYFNVASDKELFKQIKKFFEEHNKCPTPEIVAIEINEATIPEAIHAMAVETLGMFDDQSKNEDWMIDTAEKFCKDRAVYNAIMDSIEIIEGKDKKKGRDAIPLLLEEALGVSFDTAIGHDYFADAAARFDSYSSVEERIPFDLEILNKITRGGLPRKTLTCLMASVGAGKSMFMCHHAAACVKAGYNVLYITMEMAEERIAERIDANLLDVPIAAIEKFSKDTFLNKVENLKTKTHGQFIVKEYPTSGAHAGHFKALLSELKQKKKFKPDIIFIDYLNICASQRFSGSNANSYTIVKGVAEELRGLAVSENVVVFTATQYGREGMNASDVEMTHVSECVDPDAEVITMSGKIKLRDIKPGTQLLGARGFVTCTQVHHPIKKKSFLIRTRSGKELIVSEKHKFPTSRGRLSISDGLIVGEKLKTIDI